MTERSRGAANVSGIARRDYRGFELKGGSNNESVDGVGGRQLGTCQEVPGLLSDGAGEIEDADARIVEEMVDSRVKARPAADFGQHGCGYAD